MRLIFSSQLEKYWSNYWIFRLILFFLQDFEFLLEILLIFVILIDLNFRERLSHLTFDVELLGDCDTIINQLCHM